jgi:cysteinyl-tRNA synthetase
MGSCKCQPANYWMHANMLLLNGTKMSKSLGNTISPEELFTGNSEHISKGYSPMVIRFFFLQAHYTSPLNITDDALQAAEKGYRRLMEGIKILNGLAGLGVAQAGSLDAEVLQLLDQVSEDMNDDFNVPKAMSRIFELVTKVNALKGGQLSLQDISNATLARMLQTISDYVFQVFGLADELAGDKGADVLDGLMRLVIDIRQDARVRKDWPTSDKVRDTLAALKIQLKDGKDGTEWSVG